MLEAHTTHSELCNQNLLFRTQNIHVHLNWWKIITILCYFFFLPGPMSNTQSKVEDEGPDQKLGLAVHTKHRSSLAIFLRKLNILSLICFTICFGCLRELSLWDGSFEYLQHMFRSRNEKNILFIMCTLI